MEYYPVEKRTIDTQYRDLLIRILDKGVEVRPQQDIKALMILGHQMRFDLKNGFPIITERDLSKEENGQTKWSIFNQSLGELFAFLHGAHTQEHLLEWGCRWWKDWVTEAKCKKRGLPIGDLGPGSYGPAWRVFPDYCEINGPDGTKLYKGYFDQLLNIMEQMRELPHLRTHFVSPWIPQYTIRGKGKQQKVVVVPCHGWLHILLYPETKEFSLHHFQRSCDVPVGFVCNLIQYSALTNMWAQAIGYSPKELVYTISDAHIYIEGGKNGHGQLKDVEDMLKTDPQVFPIVNIDPTIEDLLGFRQEHFQISDYRPQLPPRRIWTPV